MWKGHGKLSKKWSSPSHGKHAKSDENHRTTKMRHSENVKLVVVKPTQERKEKAMIMSATPRNVKADTDAMKKKQKQSSRGTQSSHRPRAHVDNEQLMQISAKMDAVMFGQNAAAQHRRKQQPGDCRVGPWHAWSDCINPCLPSAHQQRVRTITKFGRRCPTTKQRRMCANQLAKCRPKRKGKRYGPKCPDVFGVKLTPRFVKNVIHLKAFAVATYSQTWNMVNSGKVSSLVWFLNQFGKPSKCGAPSVYTYLRRKLMYKWKHGIGMYLLKRIDSFTQHKKRGILQTIKMRDGWFFVLNYRRLGLRFFPQFMKKIRVRFSTFFKMKHKERAKNNKVIVAADAAKSGPCKCNGKSTKAAWDLKSPQKDVGQTCKKWTKYDTRPWCVVGRRCKGGLRLSGRSSLWLYCA